MIRASDSNFSSSHPSETFAAAETPGHGVADWRLNNKGVMGGGWGVAT